MPDHSKNNVKTQRKLSTTSQRKMLQKKTGEEWLYRKEMPEEAGTMDFTEKHSKRQAAVNGRSFKGQAR